ncbi:hypothetical protein KUH32_07400 [Thalassococcus sp. CAU 1522]|uniref:Thiol:disulfide interchange protein DsbD N-terminal domain-containing protein n=1 Tax=Thalassococcus arenae TaxID=2851652 RepID=A0ABS6N6F9_9RHOB|nr:hypothetical protein [Thalassococcus arenae]MBV2359594.1 hypothetical protein [Thalassococcus arenae]
MRQLALLFLCFGVPALADPPQITAAQADFDGSNWRFSVTLAHPDTGWDHYADGWRIEDADGAILGTRELLHPHVNEQPFTRNLTGVAVPGDLQTVFIRAKCSVDGWSDRRLEIPLSR